MSAAARQPMTLAEFLAWEERQEPRFEFDGVRPVAMTGGTVAHAMIGGNLRAALHVRLRGSPCRSFGPTLKIEVAGRVRYPDAFVTCTPMPPGETIAAEPVVVFEVLSEGTSRTDRIEKPREYCATPSIRRYVILEQDAIAAAVFRRKGDDWIAEALTAADTLHLPEIGVDLPLTEAYADVELATGNDAGFRSEVP